MEIWFAAQDLISPENPPEVRSVAFKLLTACIRHADKSSLDALQFYNIISNHPCMEDFDDILQAMIALTNDGKVLQSFERQIAALLSKWVRHWYREARLARQFRKREGTSSAGVSAGEFNLKQVFGFLTNVIRFNFKVFQEQEIAQLLTHILSICKRTTSKEDIRCAIVFIEALITYGYVPKSSLQMLMEVLCGCYATIKDLADQTWIAVRNLCKSYVAHSAVIILRQILEAPTHKQPRNTNAIRGAVLFLERFLLADESEGLPHVQFYSVMSAYNSALSANSSRVDLDICRAISNFLESKAIIQSISFDEWALPLQILVHCSRRTTERADGTPLYPTGAESGAFSTSQDKEGNSAQFAEELFKIINQLENICRDPDFFCMEAIVEFFIQVHRHLPDHCAELVIKHFTTDCRCYPSTENWLDNCQTLLEVIYRNSLRPSHMRLVVLFLMRKIYETVRDICDENSMFCLTEATVEGIERETDPQVVEASVKVAVEIAATTTSSKIFEMIVARLLSMTDIQAESVDNAGEEEDEKPRPLATVRPSLLSPTIYAATPATIATRGLVKIFLKVFRRSTRMARQIYEHLLKIVDRSGDSNAQIAAMKLLFRLRADAEHYIYVVDEVVVDHVASILGRTSKGSDDHITVLSNDDSSASRSNRSNSVTHNNSLLRGITRPSMEKLEKPKVRTTPLWIYPETQPLGEAPPKNVSTILQTYLDPPPPQASQDSLAEEEVDPSDEAVTPTEPPEENRLRISRWLEKVLKILQRGADWELYSYVLVYVGPQLSNKTLFRNCKPGIQLLRSIICDQLHSNRFPNTDMPPDVKKADVAVAVLNILTILIGFHEHFTRAESEAMVKAFQLGLHTWQRTARPCIHALTVCCYELPFSTSKFLSGILTKLSQIITSSAVSVHILEFLSALARLPNLYINFTEPDFRNVFGIAFRYIQHTKETAHQAPSRASYPSRAGLKEGNLADANLQEHADNPHYVLHMAYNVLTTWFLAVRLTERAKYVPWIIRGLVLGPEGIDEQTQACIDMLQRFTFSDVTLSQSLPVTPELNGNVVTKNWLTGRLTVVTISTETTSGVSHVIVRKPVCLLSLIDWIFN